MRDARPGFFFGHFLPSLRDAFAEGGGEGAGVGGLSARTAASVSAAPPPTPDPSPPLASLAGGGEASSATTMLSRINR